MTGRAPSKARFGDRLHRAFRRVHKLSAPFFNLKSANRIAIAAKLYLQAKFAFWLTLMLVVGPIFSEGEYTAVFSRGLGRPSS